MAFIGDTSYELHGRPHAGFLVRRLPDGRCQALGVKGRPGFDAAEAIGGVLYRVEWLDVDAPGQAAWAGAVVFTHADEPRAAGNCVHLACTCAGTPVRRQWWCYRERSYDGGTLSLLHEWAGAPVAA
jgi:hypothetical protein